MKESPAHYELTVPVIEALGPLLIAGLQTSLTANSAAELPRLWQEFVPYIGKIPQQINHCAYGVCLEGDLEQQFEYLAGCAVWDVEEIQLPLKTCVVAAGHYAKFKHPGHLSELRLTIDGIFSQWLPQADFQHLRRGKNSVYLLEFYGPEFDPVSGLGGMEIWLPVEAKR